MNRRRTSPTAVVAVGESLIDVVQPAGQLGSTPRPTVEHPGGSPMNIAFGLARLGRPVTLVTRIGSDARGATICSHLESAGVVLPAESIRDEPTSTATARLKADGSADYVFDLHWSLPAGLTATHPLFTTAGIVHVGSIGAFLEPGGTEVAVLMAGLAARSSPPLITFDPNVRPSILTDHDSVLKRFEQIAASATVVKLSDEDARWLYPGADLDLTIDRILQLGATLVVITRGGQGAVLATFTEYQSLPGMAVEVADTIGAGDSFMSALIDRLASLIDGGTSADSVRTARALSAERLTTIGEFAIRCAAITVSRSGANPPTHAEAANGALVYAQLHR